MRDYRASGLVLGQFSAVEEAYGNVSKILKAAFDLF